MRLTSLLVAVCLLAACSRKPTETKGTEVSYSDRADYHSYSKPGEVSIKHVDLDLSVLFDQRVLRGTATLAVEQKASGKPLLLDTRDLTISAVHVSADGNNFTTAKYDLAAKDALLGAPLSIGLHPNTSHVRISYQTSPEASGLQWLQPSQTAGKKQPFLYSQSQAIHARSWIPIQDSPGVRVTYTARIRTPDTARAVMSASFDPYAPRAELYSFEMRQAIPAYLIALAVGDLDFRPISSRTGVWAEPTVVASAAKEFEDVEKMMQAAEGLYGPYQWKRYDVLILPPSFPFGGMENPRLTFATPTLLAGDKSLVGVIAHELAHSWSGNLVTNATWRDFWLNEGFTTYIERRIQEEVYGPARSEMEALIETRELQGEFERLPDADEMLYVDLKGRDPDEGFTQVPYVKGMLFLRKLEETFGRSQFDTFLRGYFAHFSLQSITTGEFLSYMRENLFRANPTAAANIDIDAWLIRPGLPPGAPQPKSEAFDKVDQIAADWLAGKRPTDSLPVSGWTTHETLRFLSNVGEKTSSARLADLDRAFHFTRTGNSEIAFEWFRASIRSGYAGAYPALEKFLVTVGRRKYLRPLYDELARTPEGKERARAIYKKARPGYHSIAATTIDAILK